MGTAEVELAEPEPSSFDEARAVLRDLRERHRNQAHQILSWRRRAKAQVSLTFHLLKGHFTYSF